MDLKENITRAKTKVFSKIPLPKDPLPPMKVYQRKPLCETKEVQKRVPLKTLDNQAGSSNIMVREKIGTPLKLDSRHVTVRKDNYNLDWGLKVFNSEYTNFEVKNPYKEEDLIRFSTGEVDVKKVTQTQSKTPVEPISPSVENQRVKKIKQSLKRPHSRELQGLQVHNVNEAKRRHGHRERIFDRLRLPDDLSRTYVSCIEKTYSLDMLSYLVATERLPVSKPIIKPITRSCVIDWLMRVNGPDGNPAVVESACWYLDSILAMELIRLEKLQLVGAACYWIGQKLHGPCLSASKLARCSQMAFQYNELMAAEIIIMKKLEFPPQPVVAHDFIPYFAWQCNKVDPGDIEVAASFIYLSALQVNPNSIFQYPSVSAAAAVWNALMMMKKNELIPNLLACPIYKQAESKVSDFFATCLAQRNAIRTIASTNYEYRTLFEQYGAPPFYLAKKIVRAAFSYANNDQRLNSFDV